VWSIGYGHTAGVTSKSPPITEEDAEDLLRRDGRQTVRELALMVSVLVNENQSSALACFAFNVGAGNFRRSTLRALINRKAFLEAADEFPRWVNANGKQMAGLIARRKEERALFLKPVITGGKDVA
jgi:lysozyme